MLLRSDGSTASAKGAAIGTDYERYYNCTIFVIIDRTNSITGLPIVVQRRRLPRPLLGPSSITTRAELEDTFRSSERAELRVPVGSLPTSAQQIESNTQ